MWSPTYGTSHHQFLYNLRCPPTHQHSAYMHSQDTFLPHQDGCVFPSSLSYSVCNGLPLLCIRNAGRLEVSSQRIARTRGAASRPANRIIYKVTACQNWPMSPGKDGRTSSLRGWPLPGHAMTIFDETNFQTIANVIPVRAETVSHFTLRRCCCRRRCCFCCSNGGSSSSSSNNNNDNNNNNNNNNNNSNSSSSSSSGGGGGGVVVVDVNCCCCCLL